MKQILHLTMRERLLSPCASAYQPSFPREETYVQTILARARTYFTDAAADLLEIHTRYRLWVHRR